MGLQSRLNPAALPVPEYNVALPIAATYPFTIGRKADLTGVPGYGMSSKPFLPVLPEVVRAVDEDLVIERLSGEVLFWCGKATSAGVSVVSRRHRG